MSQRGEAGREELCPAAEVEATASEEAERLGLTLALRRELSLRFMSSALALRAMAAEARRAAGRSTSRFQPAGVGKSVSASGSSSRAVTNCVRRVSVLPFGRSRLGRSGAPASPGKMAGDEARRRLASTPPTAADDEESKQAHPPAGTKAAPFSSPAHWKLQTLAASSLLSCMSGSGGASELSRSGSARLSIAPRELRRAGLYTGVAVPSLPWPLLLLLALSAYCAGMAGTGSVGDDGSTNADSNESRRVRRPPRCERIEELDDLAGSTSANEGVVGEMTDGMNDDMLRISWGWRTRGGGGGGALVAVYARRRRR